MENVNILKARELIYNSPIMNYVSIEDVEKQLSEIYIFDTEEKFMQEYGGEYIGGGILKGFNRNNKNYLNPRYVSPHVIIHEVLHGLSSKFDKDGHRIVNGISGLDKTNFGVMVNEGLTDYLSSKISGEQQNHYIEGKWFFEAIEQSLIKEYNNPNILYEIYINNRVDILQDFLNKYGGKNCFEYFYNNYLFLGKEKMDEFTSKINKRFKRRYRLNNIINKFKKFLRLNKQKKLSPGTKVLINNTENSNKKTSNFTEEIVVKNYQYPDIQNNRNSNPDKSNRNQIR